MFSWVFCFLAIRAPLLGWFQLCPRGAKRTRRNNSALALWHRYVLGRPPIAPPTLPEQSTKRGSFHLLSAFRQAAQRSPIHPRLADSKRRAGHRHHPLAAVPGARSRLLARPAPIRNRRTRGQLGPLHAQAVGEQANRGLHHQRPWPRGRRALGTARASDSRRAHGSPTHREQRPSRRAAEPARAGRGGRRRRPAAGRGPGLLPARARRAPVGARGRHRHRADRPSAQLQSGNTPAKSSPR